MSMSMTNVMANAFLKGFRVNTNYQTSSYFHIKQTVAFIASDYNVKCLIFTTGFFQDSVIFI